MFKELLLNFLSIKNQIICDVADGLCLYDEEDIAELVRDWTEEGAKYWLVRELTSFYVGDSCPWCFSFKGNCIRCGYGARHGLCDNSSHSRFGDVIDKVQFMDLDSFQDLVRETKEAARKLLQGEKSHV